MVLFYNGRVNDSLGTQSTHKIAHWVPQVLLKTWFQEVPQSFIARKLNYDRIK